MLNMCPEDQCGLPACVTRCIRHSVYKKSIGKYLIIIITGLIVTAETGDSFQKRPLHSFIRYLHHTVPAVTIEQQHVRRRALLTNQNGFFIRVLGLGTQTHAKCFRDSNRQCEGSQAPVREREIGHEFGIRSKTISGTC